MEITFRSLVIKFELNHYFLFMRKQIDRVALDKYRSNK